MLFLFFFELCATPVYAQDTKQKVFVDSMKIEISSATGSEKITKMLLLFDEVFPANMELAEQLGREMEKIAIKDNIDEQLLDIYSRKGNIYNYYGRFDSMRLYVSKGLTLARTSNDRKHQRDYLNNMGMIQDRTGTVDSAIIYYKEALKLSDGENLRIHNNLGRAYNRQGNMSQAIVYFELAMQEARKKNILNAEAVIANNIGSCYIEFGDIQKGIDHFNLSIEIKEKLGDERGKLFAMTNLLNAIDSIPVKKRLAAEGIRIAEAIGHQEMKLGFLMHQGNIALLEGNFQKGLDLLLPFADMAVENPGMQGQAILHTISNLHLALGNLDEAEKYSLQSYDIGLKYNSVYDMQAARLILMDVYEAQSDYKNYFHVSKPFYQIRDSIDQNDRLEKLAALDSALAIEQKEKVALLNLTIKQKESSRYWIGLSGILTALILSLLLYSRSKRVRLQKIALNQEQEAAKQSELLNTKLKELDSLKSCLYENITHEFRTPLTVILGISNQLNSHEALVNAKGDSLEIRQKLKSINRSGNQLLKLVNNMLDLSKLDNDMLQIDYVQGDITAYIRYICESFHSLFKPRDISFKIKTLPNDIFMDYDVEKVQQIVSNLISNAIKYTANGGNILVSIERKVSQKTDLDFEFMMTVSDDGTGIPEDSLPHIFDRFYQSDDALSKSGGTGIGLALTKELVNLMNGHISVESRAGQGSKFTVILPISQNAVLVNQELTALPIPETDSSTSAMEDLIPNDKKSILVIEDNPDVAEFISSSLNHSYAVKIEYNGQDGISKALEYIPDLIISDVMMPEKDGFEVCQTLKSNELTSHIPIILLTAKSDQKSKFHGLETGADDYLIKPFNNQELQIRVRKLLELRAALKKHFSRTAFLVDMDLKSNSVDQRFLKKACDTVILHLNNGQFSVDIFSKELGISKVHLNRKLNALTDMSANKFIQSIRLQRAHEMLRHKTGNVSEIAFNTGFNSVSYFIKCFREKYGITPSNFLDDLK